MAARRRVFGVIAAGAGIAALAALAASLLIFPLYVVPSGSMKDTLLTGDHLVVNRLDRTVHRGDIIVFRYPVDIRQTFFKRCIGVPGDRIRIENQDVYLNGRKLNEPYKRLRPDATLDMYRGSFPGEPIVRVEEPALRMLRNNVENGWLVVPPNSYFVLGDNRDESLDSRHWGFVPRENVAGKPFMIYWSFDTPTEKTRWARTLQPVRGYPLR